MADMKTNVLYVKNMVCGRCIKVVGDEMQKLGLRPERITLGELYFGRELNGEELSGIREALTGNGFELLDDKRQQLVEQIKNLIIDVVHYHPDRKGSHENYSDFLSRELGQDYGYLSSQFSSVENNTIEKYIISQKIERVKELLAYGELSLSEIAYQMDYSSVAHLSAQFKKVTGLTPSHFKAIGDKRRKALDQVGGKSGEKAR